MQIDNKDYVIIADSKNKKFLAQVTNISTPITAVVCDENSKTKDSAKYIEFEPSDVVANLGKAPRYGVVHGVQIERIRQQQDDVKPWSAIKFYSKHSDTEVKLIIKSLNRASKTLLDKSIFPQEKPIDVHVKDIKGSQSGCYHHRPDKENKPSLPDIIDLRIKDYGVLDYVLYHELAHGVWFQLFDETIKSWWIKAFTKNISLMSNLENKIANMRKELIKAGSVKAYLADLENDDKDVLNHVIDYIKANYHTKIAHINTLISVDDDLIDIWPDKPIPIPKAQVLVTEYSLKNAEELWCESFAHYFDPTRQLAKTLIKLVEKTMEKCRYGSNHKGRFD